MFKEITSKLDDVALGNLNYQLYKENVVKREVTDYCIAIEDNDIPDYALDDLFDEDGIQPEQNKQLVPKPLTYEETLADKLKGEQIYVDPQNLLPEPEDLPPEYDEDEVPDYALGEEDRTAEILKDLDIADYESSAHYR